MWYLSTDNEGYLNGISANWFEGCTEYEGDIPENAFLGDMQYYKVVDGNLVADEQKHEAINYNFWKADRIAYLEDVIADRTTLSEFVEGFFDTLANSNALNLVANLISYFAAIRKEYMSYMTMLTNAKKELEELKKG